MKHDVYCERTEHNNDCHCGSRAYALDPYPEFVSPVSFDMIRRAAAPTPWIEFTTKTLNRGVYRGVHRR